jgi:hypothetical protein
MLGQAGVATPPSVLPEQVDVRLVRPDNPMRRQDHDPLAARDGKRALGGFGRPAALSSPIADRTSFDGSAPIVG